MFRELLRFECSGMPLSQQHLTPQWPDMFRITAICQTCFHLQLLPCIVAGKANSMMEVTERHGEGFRRQRYLPLPDLDGLN